MPKTARKTFALEDTELKTWFERDRAHVDLQDRETGRTLIEFWDEDVEQLLEDGFLNRKNLHRSLYDYAVHLGMIKASSSKSVHATKKTPSKRDYQYRAVVVGKGLLIGGGKRHTSSWFNTKKEADDWAWAIVEGNQAARAAVAFVTIERRHGKVVELIKWAHAGEVEL